MEKDAEKAIIEQLKELSYDPEKPQGLSKEDVWKMAEVIIKKALSAARSEGYEKGRKDVEAEIRNAILSMEDEFADCNCQEIFLEKLEALKKLKDNQ